MRYHAIPSWVFETSLPPDLKLCLVVMWSESEWSDEERSYVYAKGWNLFCDRLMVTAEAASQWTRSLGELGWVRRRTETIGWVLAFRDPFELGRMSEAPGHIYAVEYSDGMVKVGRSSDPSVRLRQLAAEAARAQITVVRSWSSPKVADMCLAEFMLLIFASTGGGGTSVPRTREYFTGADFEAICNAGDNVVRVIFGGGWE